MFNFFATLGFIICEIALVRSQVYFDEIRNARVSSMTDDGEWVGITGESKGDAGIYASYSKRHLVENSLLFVTNDDGTLIDGCSESLIPKNNGSIVLLARGRCPFRDKSQNVWKSGGAAMILQNFKDYPNPLWMSAGILGPPPGVDDIVSVAVPYDIGEDLLERASDVFPKKLTVRIQDNGVFTDTYPYQGKFTSQVIFYTCGVAVAAMVLVMATRICRRRVPTYDVGIIGQNNDTTPPADKSAELLASLERYEFEVKATTRVDEEDVENGTVGSEDDDAPSCCICICEYEKGDTVYRLPCGHEFHGDCVSEWLREHVDCPLCKADVYAMYFGEEPTEESNENLDNNSNINNNHNNNNNINDDNTNSNNNNNGEVTIEFQDVTNQDPSESDPFLNQTTTTASVGSNQHIMMNELSDSQESVSSQSALLPQSAPTVVEVAVDSTTV